MLCCSKCKGRKKFSFKEPLFILYCFECKIYFNDEKKYNKHLKKVHNENK